MPSTAKRFVLRDRAESQSSDLTRWDHMNPRYQVIDTEAASDPVYDEFTTKRPAAATVRDLNKGLYGPLAEDQA